MYHCTNCRPESAAGGFGEPKSQREADAIDEKIAALTTLFEQRVSVLTGGAGTGKTSVLKVFLRELRKIEGPSATLLAAPTGKARVRLQTTTGVFARARCSSGSLCVMKYRSVPKAFASREQGGR